MHAARLVDHLHLVGLCLGRGEIVGEIKEPEEGRSEKGQTQLVLLVGEALRADLRELLQSRLQVIGHVCSLAVKDPFPRSVEVAKGVNTKACGFQRTFKQAR